MYTSFRVFCFKKKSSTIFFFETSTIIFVLSGNGPLLFPGCPAILSVSQKEKKLPRLSPSLDFPAGRRRRERRGETDAGPSISRLFRCPVLLPPRHQVRPESSLFLSSSSS
jgi:hypothetical protein